MLEPTTGTGEGGHPGGGAERIKAELPGQRDDAGGVGGVVVARHRHRQGDHLAGGRREGRGGTGHRAAEHLEAPVGVRCGAEGDDPLDRPPHQGRTRVVRTGHPHRPGGAARRRLVRVGRAGALEELDVAIDDPAERAVKVQVLTLGVGQQHRCSCEGQVGVVGLVGLDDEPFTVPPAGRGLEGGHGRTDQPAHPGAGAAERQRHHGGRGGLSMGPRHGDRRPQARQARQRVRSGQHRQPRRRGRHPLGVVRADRSGADHKIGALDMARIVADVGDGPSLDQPVEHRSGPLVAARDVMAQLDQDHGQGRDAGSGQPDEVDVTGLTAQPPGHVGRTRVPGAARVASVVAGQGHRSPSAADSTRSATRAAASG